jgi:hypothetical protein
MPESEYNLGLVSRKNMIATVPYIVFLPCQIPDSPNKYKDRIGKAGAFLEATYILFCRANMPHLNDSQCSLIRGRLVAVGPTFIEAEIDSVFVKRTNEW